MREILFRGFYPCDGPDTIVVDGEKVKGRWVEGYIVRHPVPINRQTNTVWNFSESISNNFH